MDWVVQKSAHPQGRLMLGLSAQSQVLARILRQPLSSMIHSVSRRARSTSVALLFVIAAIALLWVRPRRNTWLRSLAFHLPAPIFSLVCYEEGGSVNRHQPIGSFVETISCNVATPLPDAGKACSSNLDCFGECRIPDIGPGQCARNILFTHFQP